jgi:tetratricopeptide (TPR) repeat protein
VREEPPPDDTDRLLRDADARAHAGAHVAAARLYDQVARLAPPSAFRDRALYGLGRLLVQPDNPGRDYRQAYAWFDRLLRDHPRSPLAPDARAWHELLGAYLARSEEIEQLKRLDLELERAKRP